MIGSQYEEKGRETQEASRTAGAEAHSVQRGSQEGMGGEAEEEVIERIAKLFRNFDGDFNSAREYAHVVFRLCNGLKFHH